jgi:hypothetical protein
MRDAWPPRVKELARWTVGTLLVAGLAVGAYLYVKPSETDCSNNTLTCGVLVNFGTTIGIAVVVGIFWFRFRTRLRVTHHYVRAVRKRPDTLLDQAPQARQLANMEPRTDLNRRVMQELRHLPAMGLQVIEGDAGSGKTVALLKLGAHLARRGCVPVLVSLRGAALPLDFMALAQEQFLRAVNRHLPSDTDGDRLWRQLCRNRLLVVLADGLDEVVSTSVLLEPKSLFAFTPSDKRQLPVVVTSRPRTLPEEWRTSVFGIGEGDDQELSEKQVVRYLQKTAGLDPDSGAVLARRLELGRTPFYLEVVKRLGRRALPDRLPDDDNRAARRALLDRFVEQLCETGLERGGALTRDDREAAVKAAGRLAFNLLLKREDSVLVAHTGRNRAIANATELGLFRIRGFGETAQIRFGHPILQAHLAAGAMGSLVHRREGRPAWEYLAARAETEEAFLALQTYAAQADREVGVDIRIALVERANELRDRKALRVPISMCAAEVARESGDSGGVPDICAAVTSGWPDASPPAKLLAIDALSRLAFLEAGQSPGERKVQRMLWRLAKKQPYLVEWRLVRAIADCAADGYDALEGQIKELVCQVSSYLKDNPKARDDDPVLEDADPALKVLAKFLPRLCDEAAAAGSDEKAKAARHDLEDLVKLVGRLDGRRLGVEASLAQGFKEAALHGDRADVDALIIALSRQATFWFSRINVLQALALRNAQHHSPHRGTSEVRKAVERAQRDPHPFVQRAARLCLAALDSPAQVRHYVWEDEVEVVAVASGGLSREAHRLVADIVLLLNMNEQLFGQDKESKKRLRRTQKDVGELDDLPHCLGGTFARNRLLKPGDDVCRKDGRCSFRLCPYRPDRAPASSAYREFSADFCREERPLRAGLVRRLARNGHFWRTVETRSREAAARQPR